MAQYEMNLRDYWLIIRRRRVIIVVSMLLVAAFSFWFAKQQVPQYQATAAVKYEQSTSLSGLLVEVLSYSSGDTIETQASLIKSYPILEEVARRLGRLPDMRGQAIRESKAYTAALDSIAAKVRTARVPSTSILEITATSANPREARDLANTVAETYRDYNRGVRNARITEARKFIEAQLREVEARVKRAEEEVWAFREANRIIAPGAESTMLLSLFTQLRGDIEKTRQHRSELELAQTRLGRSDSSSLNDRVFVDSANPALQKLQATQMELLLERNNLALEVTDKHPRLQAIEDRLREVRSEMRREVTAQVALLRNREDILNRQMGELLQRNREVPAIELGLQRLQRDAKVNDDLLTLLKTKHQEALIKESEGIEEVTLIRPAAEPTTPVGGEVMNTVLVGALLGLMLGLILAFVQETLDTSIGTIEDVETYLQVPVLGIVPHIDARGTVQRLIDRRPALAEMDPDALQSHALLITHFDPKSPVAEAYRTIRTNIQFMRMERDGKVLVVTSPTLQEGKTTTIVNLALTMAQNGQRTLLIGANLRRPSISRFFGIEREPGLSDILVGSARWRDCIRTVADILMGRFEMEDIMASPGLDNLHIIESGPIPANPSELLSTPAMGQFLREVRDEYDIVLIDTPPVLPVTDSAIVAGQVDGVILVYQAGKVGRIVLKRAKAHLESARGKVWGVVLNDVQAEIAGYTYTHYYTHYYGEESHEEARPGRLGRIWNRFRSHPKRDGVPASQAVAPATSPVAPAAARPPTVQPEGASPRTSTGNRYRSMGQGVLLVMLGAVLAGLVGWQLGWFGSSDRPRELLRKKLETPASPETRRPGTSLMRPERAPISSALAPATNESPSMLEPPPVAQQPMSVVPAVPALPPAPASVAPSPYGVPPPPAGVAPPATTAPSPYNAAPPTSAAPPPYSVAPPTSVAPSPSRVAPPPTSMVPSPLYTVSPSPATVAPAPYSVTPPPSVTPSPYNVAPRTETAPPATAMFPPRKTTPAPPPFASPWPVPARAPVPSAAVPAAAKAVTPSAAPAIEPPAPTRFAVEFGPFLSPTDAERTERQLGDAGHQTVRFRQQTGGGLYAVLIERVPGARDAETLVAALREQGFSDVIPVVSADQFTVRVGEPVALRGAVVLAERLRAQGYHVRVAAQPGEAVAFIIRHGNFGSREEAEERSGELARLGLPNHVVRVK